MRILKTCMGLFVGLIFMGGCGGGGSDSSNPMVLSSTGAAVTLENAFPNLVFNQPVALLQHPTDTSRWYVVEQAGLVLTFSDPMAVSADVFIDIGTKVTSGGEGGLLSMAFHPAFDVNGAFFLSYTGPGTPLISYIARFTSMDDGISADPLTEEIILSVDQPYGNHNGGHIAFGPFDGYLYIGLGDGGSVGDPLQNAQDTQTLLGSMLRIDVDGPVPYGIPADNPFVGGSTGLPEIYAWGFRNPWRWSFDIQTGDLWLGDVGQNRWEEIDRVEVGANYGWNILEGNNCYPVDPCSTAGLAPPVVAYDRSQGVSVTGGYVYRGAALPGLFGDYVYGDFGSGTVWRLTDTQQGGTTSELLINSGARIASFAQDHDGEIYLIDYGVGEILRFVPAP
jgi:glucose/arabinose dehydrogenase